MPGKPVYKPLIAIVLVIFIGLSVAYLLNPEIYTGLGSKLTGAYNVCKSIESNPSKIWVGEDITFTMGIQNEGVRQETRIIQLIYDGELIQETSIDLESQQLKPLECTVSSSEPRIYDLQINGLDNEFSYTVAVSIPDESVLRRPTYYYSFSERYVDEHYSIPEDNTVEDLAEFLQQVQFPMYSLNDFDCSDASALLEWLLEGAGFEAYIVRDDSHMWVQAETSNGLVALESTNLCTGNVYHPPGIVERPDGSFREFSSKYMYFLEWKGKYPSDKYGYDPDITYMEWQEEYFVESIVPGIPTLSGYYNTKNRYFSPFNLYIGEITGNITIYSDEAEFDWWTTPGFTELYPFKYW